MEVYRSLLFAPGSDRHKMEKALGSEADAVVFDLEDAVAPSEKVDARQMIHGLLEELEGGAASGRPAIFVRTNGMDTPWGLEDLKAVYSPKITGVMVPKAETREQMERLHQELDALTVDGHEPEVLPFIESARAVKYLGEIAAGSSRIGRVCFGGVDYSLDVGASSEAEDMGLFYARSMLVLESRVAGLAAPIDTVYANFRNLEGLRQDALQAKKLGFFGKLVIHPAQVAPVNEVFTPSEAEVERARRIVAAYDEAVQGGVGASNLSGEMVELPIAERARRLLELARSLESRN